METLKQKYEDLYQQIKSAGKSAAEWFPQFNSKTSGHPLNKSNI